MMQTYEVYLREEIQKTKNEYNDLLSKLGPLYRVETMKYFEIFKNSLKQINQECTNHFKQLEKEKIAMIENAKKDNESKLSKYQDESKVKIDNAIKENDDIYNELLHRHENEIGNLENKKITLEKELHDLQQKYNESLLNIKHEERNYEHNLRKLEEDNNNNIHNTEQMYIIEIDHIYAQLKSKIDIIIANRDNIDTQNINNNINNISNSNASNQIDDKNGFGDDTGFGNDNNDGGFGQNNGGFGDDNDEDDDSMSDFELDEGEEDDDEDDYDDEDIDDNPFMKKNKHKTKHHQYKKVNAKNQKVVTNNAPAMKEVDNSRNEENEFKRNILREFDKRTKLLNDIKEEERIKIKELLEIREIKVNELNIESTMLTNSAESKFKNEYIEVQNKYQYLLENLKTDYKYEMEKLETYEEDLIEKQNSIIKNEINSLEESINSKTLLNETMKTNIDKYKHDINNMLNTIPSQGKVAIPLNINMYDSNLQTYCRIRPVIQMDIEHGNYTESIASESFRDVSLKIDPNVSPEHYEFDQVYPRESTLKEVYQPVKIQIHNYLDRPFINIFSSGVQFSGKSYLFEGRDQDGIMYRSVKSLFKQMKQNKLFSFKCEVSVLEIYLNNIYDLEKTALTENNSTIPYLVQIQDDGGSNIVPAYSRLIVNSYNEFIDIIEKTFTRRIEATENLPDHLSKSHLLIQFEITKTDKTTRNSTTHLVNFVELASFGIEFETSTENMGPDIKWICDSLQSLSKSLLNRTYSESDSLSKLLSNSLVSVKGSMLFYLNVPSACFNINAIRSSLKYTGKLLHKDTDRTARILSKQ